MVWKRSINWGLPWNLIIRFYKFFKKGLARVFFFAQKIFGLGTRWETRRDSLTFFLSEIFSQKISKNPEKSSKNVLPGIEMGQIPCYDYVFSDYLIIFYNLQFIWLNIFYFVIYQIKYILFCNLSHYLTFYKLQFFYYLTF